MLKILEEYGGKVVVALAVFEKVMESKDDDSLVELFKPKEAEAYMQITNIVHKESKNRDLKAHLMATWGVDDTVAVEIEKLVEHVMTDFIHVWFDLISDDGDFVWVIKEVLGNVFGLIVQRGQSKVDPIAFVCDKIANILTKSLKVYRSAKEEVMRERPELFAAKPIVSEEWKQLQLALADEFRKKGRLHGMFGLRVATAPTTADGAAPAAAAAASGPVRLPINIGQEMRPELSSEEFFDETRVHACEVRYLRHISTLIFPILMCNDGERNCKVIRSLLRELLANSVLYPIFALFVPSTMNYWLSIPRGCEIVAELIKAGQTEAEAAATAAAAKAAAAATADATSGITYLETSIAAMYDSDSYPVATAPDGFNPDSCWLYLGGMIGIDETEALLADRAVGTFLLRAMEMPGYYSLSFVEVANASAETEAGGGTERASDGGQGGPKISSESVRGVSAAVETVESPVEVANGRPRASSGASTGAHVSHVLIQATPPSTFELVVMDMDTDKYPEDVSAASLSEFLRKLGSFARHGVVFSKDSEGRRVPRADVQLGEEGPLRMVRDGSGGRVNLSDSMVFTPLDNDSGDEGGGPVTVAAGAPGEEDEAFIDDDVIVRESTTNHVLPMSTPSPGLGRRSVVGGAASVDDDFRFSAERMYLLGELSGAVDEFVTTYNFFLAKAGRGVGGEGQSVEIADDRGCHSVGRLLTIVETILCYGRRDTEDETGSVTLYDYFRDLSAMLLSWNEESANLEEMLVGVQMTLDAVSLALTVDGARTNPLMFASLPVGLGSALESDDKGLSAALGIAENENDRWSAGSRGLSVDARGSVAVEPVGLEAMELKAWEHAAFQRNRLRALIYHLLSTGGLITCLQDMLADVQGQDQQLDAPCLAERYWHPHSFAFSGGGKSLAEIIVACEPLLGKTVILREKSTVEAGSVGKSSSGRDRDDSNSDAGGSPRRFTRPLTQKMAAGAMNFITMPVKMLNTTVSTVRNVANNVTSRFDSDSSSVPTNESDSFLVFARNADIVDVSRMRRELADKEWGRRRGSVQFTANKEGSALDADYTAESEQESLGRGALLLRNTFASSKKETVVLTDYQKRAEKVFKLSMLLRDRPVIEVLSIRNIWHASPMKFTAHITLVEKRESNKSALHPLGSSVLLYKIAVEMTRSCLFKGVGGELAGADGETSGAAATTTGAAAGGSGFAVEAVIAGSSGGSLSDAVAKRDAKLKQKRGDPAPSHMNLVETWTVERRYSDFEELHKALKGAAGSVLSSRHISLPPKHNMSVGQWSAAFMEKRKQKLQAYMDNMLATFVDSEEMRVFLSPLGTGQVELELGSGAEVSGRLVSVQSGQPEALFWRCTNGPLLRVATGGSSSVTGAIGGAASNMFHGVRSSIMGDTDNVKADLAEARAMVAAAAAAAEEAAAGAAGDAGAGSGGASAVLETGPLATAGFNEYTSPAKMKNITKFKNIDSLLQKKLSQTPTSPAGAAAAAAASHIPGATPDIDAAGPVAGDEASASQEESEAAVAASDTGKPKIHPAMDAGKIDMAILDKRLYPLLKELLDAGKMGAIRRNMLVVILSSAKMLFSTEISKWMSEQSKDAVSHRTTAITLEYLRSCVWPNGKLVAAGKVQTPEQDALMRERNKAFLVEKLHNSYVGNGQVGKAIDKVQELLDNPYILKSIAYMIIDMLLIELFPELTGKLAGMDAIAL